MDQQTFFLLADGKGHILGRGALSPAVLPLVIEALALRDIDAVEVNQGSYATASDENFFVANGALVARPSLPFTVNKSTIVADNEDMALISGLPVPCTAEVSGGPPQEVTEGNIQLSAREVGDILITIHAWPHRSATLQFQGVAAPLPVDPAPEGEGEDEDEDEDQAGEGEGAGPDNPPVEEPSGEVDILPPGQP